MVEVFRTDIDTGRKADFILEQLAVAFPNCEINFDLDDCDHILRMETKVGTIDPKPVTSLVTGYGFTIEVLPDSPVANPVIIK